MFVSGQKNIFLNIEYSEFSGEIEKNPLIFYVKVWSNNLKQRAVGGGRRLTASCHLQLQFVH